MSSTAAPAVNQSPSATKNSREQKGRKWLFISFLFCPCHLPVIMAVLGVIFGGSAFGVLVGRNTIAVGIVFGVIYLILLTVGFRHLRAATKQIDCSEGGCKLPS